MSSPNADELRLVRRAARGDQESIQRLFGEHRNRLRRMIAVRMDPRLNARVDPSDVVQEVLVEAARRLPAYARQVPLPFYPWIRQIAWDHLVDLHQRHIRAQKRSIHREEAPHAELSDDSTAQLAQQMMDSGSGPTGRLLREELCARVRAALAQLDARDREVLAMRHLEQLQVSEIAALWNISEGAVKMRRLRAAERLRALLEREA